MQCPGRDPSSGSEACSRGREASLMKQRISRIQMMTEAERAWNCWQLAAGAFVKSNVGCSVKLSVFRGIPFRSIPFRTSE
jgi:hypothetical protein